MTMTYADIERHARELAIDERARLAEALFESLHASRVGVETAWDGEVSDRIAAFDRGEMSGYPAEDVFAEAWRLAR